MHTFYRIFSKFQTLIVAAMVIVGLPLLSNCANAESNWLKEGTDLLKGFGKSSGQDELTLDEIGAGLKEALHVGTEHVVAQLGRQDGFNSDASIHIPLPEELNSVKSMLDTVGMSGLLDDLELKLNRAAEAATPKAKELFWQAITEMSFDDVMTIYKGPEDSATRYFQKKMSPALAEDMRPVIKDSLSEVGAIQSYDNVMGAYSSLPFVPDVKANLTDYVIEKGMDGIFHYVAKEEAAIRQDPAKQTTDLLKQVFGAD
jgi:hypothetical protein